MSTTHNPLLEYFTSCNNEHIEPDFEIIKKYIENGVQLNGFTDEVVPPLLIAVESSYSPEIIQYLVDKGGIDWDYKVKAEWSVYYLVDCICEILKCSTCNSNKCKCKDCLSNTCKCIQCNCKNCTNNFCKIDHSDNKDYDKFKIFDDTIVVYKNLKNILIYGFHNACGSVKLINQAIKENHLRNCILYSKIFDKSYIEEKFFDEEKETPSIPSDIIDKNINKIQEYCKILNFDYSILKDELLEFPSPPNNIYEHNTSYLNRFY